MAVVNRIHKQALKTAIFIVFSVFSEVINAIIQPEASWWGLGFHEFHLISSGFILVPFPIKTTVFSTFELHLVSSSVTQMG